MTSEAETLAQRIVTGAEMLFREEERKNPWTPQRAEAHQRLDRLAHQYAVLTDNPSHSWDFIEEKETINV